ncbi:MULTISPECIES: MarR family winged helix-turn-helix transcriptional regulator [unclassified Phenylobacterium]|uniref:MarR family winged helix-turn-helix transcriptional regulator n=1 Tax=unclassified Phenylobacterium TaxID=2640670 RepID=UPI00083B16E7|nr:MULTISPECIES: MarR family transcriptional regulator [unclassified Phenylobacterium]
MTRADSSLGTLLRNLIDALDGDVERAYAAAGLDFRPRFTPVVRLLAAEGALRIKDLAARVGLSHSALSQTVGQLVAQGWVRLEPGADGRERVARLTPRALGALPDLQRCWAATAEAAASLDAELGLDLEDVARGALAALQRRSFRSRIEEARASTA